MEWMERGMKFVNAVFTTHVDAVVALREIPEPRVLMLFAREPEDSVVIAVNGAAAADPSFPAVGDHPDIRRNRELTADCEVRHLHQSLLERGHVRQILAMDGNALIELVVTRVIIGDDSDVYGFVQARRVGSFEKADEAWLPTSRDEIFSLDPQVGLARSGLGPGASSSAS
jgi:hypothetical protein